MSPSPSSQPCSPLLSKLRRLDDLTGEQCWEHFSPAELPDLFRLLTLAADLPSVAEHGTLSSPPADLWPQLAEVAADLVRLQRLVQAPTANRLFEVIEGLPAQSPAAHQELTESHCVTVDDLLDASQAKHLDKVVQQQQAKQGKDDFWGHLERDSSPGIFAVFDQALASPTFERLTGYRAERDTYSLTLSLQDLEAQGIGWHQDLYWPKEWVGKDVFAVLYALGDDAPTKGGAFLYYVPWLQQAKAVYRRRHQATILWNGRRAEDRLLHAVSGYSGDDTSRHLIILQCLRRRPDTSV